MAPNDLISRSEAKELLTDRMARYQRTLDSGAASGDTGEGVLALVLIGLRDLASALDALPSAALDQLPAGEGKPPMLYATITQEANGQPQWWLRVDVTESWIAVQQPNGVMNLHSGWLTVDRERSDLAALALFDNDMSGDAAKE